MVLYRNISVKAIKDGPHPKLIFKIEDKLQSRFFFLLDDFANHDLVILAFRSSIAKPKTKR